MSDEQAQKAIDFIRDNAPKYANAKAERVYIENYLKSKKAILMADEGGTLGAKEAYALSHPDYIALLGGLRQAVEEEEKLKYLIEGAKLRFEHWKTEQFNMRVEAWAMN
jgi:hypothetical protein